MSGVPSALSNFQHIPGATTRILNSEREHRSRIAVLLCSLLLVVLVNLSVAAQSTEIDYPLPIRTNEIGGTIVPRDLGDARLTRYFYSLTGTPGDLIIVVESTNLEGDVDVFTAGTLRPLAKIPMYAGASASNAAKTIYFKTRESLILRVEARTPNDNNGSFRIRFDGSFEPIGSDVPDPELVVPTVSATKRDGKKLRRVTATGARIDEPEPEPEPQPTETSRDEAERPETPASDEPATTDAPTETAEAKEPTPPPRTTRRRARTSARTTGPRRPARRTPGPVEPAPTGEVATATGPRLILEMRDGMRVERYMTTVRRVTVENGQIVVITKDGKVDRQPMSNVLRVAIEP